MQETFEFIKDEETCGNCPAYNNLGNTCIVCISKEEKEKIEITKRCPFAVIEKVVESDCV